jgi:hypothetical protein
MNPLLNELSVAVSSEQSLFPAPISPRPGRCSAGLVEVGGWSASLRPVA